MLSLLDALSFNTRNAPYERLFLHMVSVIEPQLHSWSQAT